MKNKLPINSITIDQYIKFLNKLGYIVEKNRGKVSHIFLKHKKYLPLTVPKTNKYVKFPYWKQLIDSIGKDEDWIYEKLLEYKIIKRKY